MFWSIQSPPAGWNEWMNETDLLTHSLLLLLLFYTFAFTALLFDFCIGTFCIFLCLVFICSEERFLCPYSALQGGGVLLFWTCELAQVQKTCVIVSSRKTTELELIHKIQKNGSPKAECNLKECNLKESYFILMGWDYSNSP